MTEVGTALGTPCFLAQDGLIQRRQLASIARCGHAGPSWSVSASVATERTHERHGLTKPMEAVTGWQASGKIILYPELLCALA